MLDDFGILFMLVVVPRMVDPRKPHNLLILGRWDAGSVCLERSSCIVFWFPLSTLPETKSICASANGWLEIYSKFPEKAAE